MFSKYIGLNMIDCNRIFRVITHSPYPHHTAIVGYIDLIRTYPEYLISRVEVVC